MSGSLFSGIDWFNPLDLEGPDTYLIRIMPPLWSQFPGKPMSYPNKFYYAEQRHFLRKTKFDTYGIPFSCTQLFDNIQLPIGCGWVGSCYLCDRWRSFMSDIEVTPPFNPRRPYYYHGDNFHLDLSNLAPKEYYYMNVIVRGQEDRGVLKWGVRDNIFSLISHHYLHKYRSSGLETARCHYDFKLIMKWRNLDSGSFIDYSESHFVESFSPMGTKEQIEEWGHQLHDLNKLTINHTKREVVDAFENTFGRQGLIKFRKLDEPWERSNVS